MQQEALQNTAWRRFSLYTTAMKRGYLWDLNEQPLAPPIGFKSGRGSLAAGGPSLACSLAGSRWQARWWARWRAHWRAR